MDKYVMAPESHQEYLSLVGGLDYLADLGKWRQDTQTWCGLLQQDA
jgi:hypothetical protein